MSELDDDLDLKMSSIDEVDFGLSPNIEELKEDNFTGKPPENLPI